MTTNNTKTLAPQTEQRRGVVTVLIGDAQRTLKFGLNTLVAFGQLYTDSPLDFSAQFEKNPMQALRDMTYCGLLARKEQNNLPEGFSAETVGEWIDEMPQDAWQQVRKTMLEAMALGNAALNSTPTAQP